MEQEYEADVAIVVSSFVADWLTDALQKYCNITFARRKLGRKSVTLWEISLASPDGR
jgi:hypothetical protein